MLGSSVREIVAPVLRECPPECGIVSITGVEVSSDLSYATLSLSALQNPEAALAFLEGKRRDLQKRLVALQTHRIPKLRFRIDRAGEQGARIEKLLDELS